MTLIEWTEQTWNPIVGCSKISDGCKNCYAIHQSFRNNAIGQTYPPQRRGRLAFYENLTTKTKHGINWTGVVNFVESSLQIPLKRRKPTTYFVNSMSDIFHEQVPDEWINQIMAIAYTCPHHTFQFLTKRPQRMLEYFTIHPTAPNIWLGVTVENQRAADERIPLLLKIPSRVRFLSCEPLLENVTLPQSFLESGNYCPYCNKSGIIVNDQGLHSRCQKLIHQPWVIVGGETGHKARYCDTEWIAAIINQCKQSYVPVFMKNMGSNSILSKKHFSLLPSHLKVRQRPPN